MLSVQARPRVWAIATRRFGVAVGIRSSNAPVSVFDGAALTGVGIGGRSGLHQQQAVWQHLFKHAEFYSRHQGDSWALGLEIGPQAAAVRALREAGSGPNLLSRVVRADGGNGSEDGAKLLLELPDGRRVETAIIVSKRRGRAATATVCVSSQAGCAMACRFCDTGLLGGGGAVNLPTWAILEQVFHAEALLQREWRVSGKDRSTDAKANVVFMGMGEPLLNYKNVLGASRALCGEGAPRRQVTLSTVGVSPRIEALARDGPASVNLALSLHGPTQELRELLLPVAARAWPLPGLLEAVRSFEANTGNGVLLEYILIRGINDDEGHASQLADLIKRECLQCAGVNLIPYNPTAAGAKNEFRTPSDSRCKMFRKALRDAGVPNATIRFSTKRGRSITAACGQLGLRERS